VCACWATGRCKSISRHTTHRTLHNSPHPKTDLPDSILLRREHRRHTIISRGRSPRFKAEARRAPPPPVMVARRSGKGRGAHRGARDDDGPQAPVATLLVGHRFLAPEPAADVGQ
jgi:hypothetical protein